MMNCNQNQISISQHFMPTTTQELQLEQKTKTIKIIKYKNHKNKKNTITPTKIKKHISSYKKFFEIYSCGLCLVLLGFFSLSLVLNLQFFCSNLSPYPESSIEMPCKRVNNDQKVESRRKKVVDSWSGSPFSYFQYLYQQLRSENYMDIAFRMRFQEVFGLTESVDENSFNAQNPSITVGEIFEKYMQLEHDETHIIEENTPNSRKKARTLKNNRNRREKLAMDSFLSPGRMAEVRIQKASKKAQRRSDPIVRSQEASKAAARRSDPIRKAVYQIHRKAAYNSKQSNSLHLRYFCTFCTWKAYCCRRGIPLG